MATPTWKKADRADAALDEFDTSSTAEHIYLGTRRWSTRELVSAAIRRVLDAGGGEGGGSLPDWWTVGEDPDQATLAGAVDIQQLSVNGIGLDPAGASNDDRLAYDAGTGSFKTTRAPKKTVNLTAPQLLDLHNNEAELLPKPSTIPGIVGERWYYVIHGFVFHYRFVSAPYTYDSGLLSTALLTMWGNSLPAYDGAYFQPLHLNTGSPHKPSDLFKGTTDMYVIDGVDGSNLIGYAWTAADIEDQPMNLVIDPSVMPDGLDDGDGTLTVRLWYDLINGAA